MFFCRLCSRSGDMVCSSFSHDLSNASDWLAEETMCLGHVNKWNGLGGNSSSGRIFTLASIMLDSKKIILLTSYAYTHIWTHTNTCVHTHGHIRLYIHMYIHTYHCSTCKYTLYTRAGRYWNLLLRYIMAKNIMVFLIFSNYAMECIIVVDTFIATYCMKTFNNHL